MNISLIIPYIVIIYLLYYAITFERLDLFCPGCSTFDRTKCGDGKGKYYNGGLGKNTDTVSKLLDKIQLSSECDVNTVKWRRSLILSIIGIFLVYIIVLRRIPQGDEFFLSVLLMFIVIYGSFSYYQFHYNRYPTYNINKNLELIRSKLKLKSSINIII